MNEYLSNFSTYGRNWVDSLLGEGLLVLAGPLQIVKIVSVFPSCHGGPDAVLA